MKNIILTFIILFSNGCSSQDNKNYFDLGKQEMKNQNLEKAVEYLSIAIDKNQNKSEAFFARGLCNNLLKKFDNSTDDFTSAEKLGFIDVKLYTLRGFAYNQINKNELALKDVSKAIEMNPEFYPKNYYNKASLEIKLNRNEEALNDFNEYIKREQEPLGYFERGKLFYNLGRNEEACKDFETSLKLGNKSEEILRLKEEICK